MVESPRFLSSFPNYFHMIYMYTLLILTIRYSTPQQLDRYIIYRCYTGKRIVLGTYYYYGGTRFHYILLLPTRISPNGHCQNYTTLSIYIYIYIYIYMYILYRYLYIYIYDRTRYESFTFRYYKHRPAIII